MKLRISYVAGVAVVIALVTTAWVQHVKIARLQQELASVREQATRPRAQEEIAVVSSTSSAVSLPTNSKGLTPEEKQARLEQFQEKDRARARSEMADPRKVAFISARTWVDLDIRYADLFRRLGLSPEQTDKFKQMLIERSLAVRDTFALAEKMSPRARATLQSQMMAGVDAEIAAQLGAPVLDELQNYEKNEPWQRRVSRIDKRLSYAATPLQDEQQQKLVGVLSTIPVPSLLKDDKGPAARELYLAKLKEYNTSVMEAAARFLSPRQAAAYAELLREELKVDELR